MSSTKSLKFFMPPPPLHLSPNARVHWSKKAAAAKKARAAAKKEGLRVLAAAGIPAPLWGRARYTAHLCKVKINRWPDPDNFMASLKPYIDGLADAGIVANDRNLWPDRPVYEKVFRMPRIEIVITPEDEA